MNKDFSNNILHFMKTELINKEIIARIDGAGVFHGTLDYLDAEIIRMKNVRRIYSWMGALSVTDMAVNGIRTGKVTVPVTTVEFMSRRIIELNKCSDKATESIKSIESWKDESSHL